MVVMIVNFANYKTTQNGSLYIFNLVLPFFFFFSSYSMPMASMEVVLHRSAFTMSSKLNILVHEGARRIRNCSTSLPWMTVCGFLNKLMVSMLWDGYPERTRRIVAQMIVARHNTNLHNLKEYGRKLYRSKEDRVSMERIDKATWFRKAGATATLFVPTTPGSQLAKGIRDVLSKYAGPIGTTTKVVEKPGMAIHTSISSNNPFPRGQCGRSKCPYLRDNKPCLEKCAKESITYRAECIKCEVEQKAQGAQVKKRVYFDESSRTLYHRPNQHISEHTKANRGEGRGA